MTRPTRRGINLIGLVLLILLMVGIGLGLSNMARQAGRSSHWFYHSQVAHDVADAGLKQAYYLLTQASSRQAAEQPPYGSPQLLAIYDAIVQGTTGSALPFFSSSDAAALPAPVRTLLDRVKELEPKLEVTVEPLDSQPLWTGLLQGIPATPGEAKGGVRIVARASVRTPAGVAVDRVITLEKGFKVVNALPPLLGRFALFVAERGAEDPNKVPMRFDPNTGDATPEGARPLTLKSKTAAPLVAAGTNVLDRGKFLTALDPEFLDRQGWVYLGGSGTQTWKLRPAHGYSEAGESPLLPGYRPFAAIKFRESQSEDDAFKQRFTAGFQTANLTCLPRWPPTVPSFGIHHIYHGWAQNYEQITLAKSLHGTVSAGGARKPLMDLGPGETSVLRLFGNPDALSPTLVFGPVERVLARRAWISTFLGDIGTCQKPGILSFQLYRIDQFPEPSRTILNSAFQSDYPKYGTGVRDDMPFSGALQAVLSGQGSGTYLPDGVLGQTATAPVADKPFKSSLLPWLGTITGSSGVSAAALEKLARGNLDSDAVYKGMLSGGMAAFLEAMKAKLTYEIVKPAAFTQKFLVGSTLKVPGVVLLRQKTALTIPAVNKIEGGILLTEGPITITGDITGAGEPLTLVALSGDITIESGARNIEAYLVAPAGQIKFAGGDVQVTGGLASKELDVTGLARPGKRTLIHSENVDPQGPNKSKLRVYYGGEDRLLISGGGS